MPDGCTPSGILSVARLLDQKALETDTPIVRGLIKPS